MPERTIEGVLFDLDGTLLDTALDLGWALNRVLREQGRPALDLEQIQPQVSHGSQGLIELGFPDLDADMREPLRKRLLEHYTANLSRLTRPFPGIDEILGMIEARGIPWGIVTNKPARLTDPLLADLGLDKRAASVISGDTTARNKPFPDPLLLAARQMQVNPQHCVYIGDAQRDIEAGRRAGMRTLVALFGYIDAVDEPESWQADAMIETTEALYRWTEERL